MDQSLRSFLERLEKAEELRRIRVPVDPLKNLAAVQWKALNERGKAVLCENLSGFPGWRVAGQILADRRKWALAFETDQEQLLSLLRGRVDRRIGPETLSGPAPVQEVVVEGDAVRLSRLPAIMTSERDLSPFIASGMCIITDPDTGIRNVSIHRLQVHDDRHLGILMVPRHAWMVYEKYRQMGRAMPIAVVVGAHPALYFAASFTGSFDLDEWELAGALLGEPLRMVPGRTVPLDVPAEAELVIEGEILPGELREEGPFGETTGLYADRAPAPVLRVKALTHRSDPIFYAVQCGMPNTDTQSMTALTIETVLWDRLATVDGRTELHDLRVVTETGDFLIVIKLTPRFDGQVRNLLMAALSGPYLHPKIAVAVDDDIDIHDLREVFWSMATRVNPAEDVLTIPGTRNHTLDWSIPRRATSSGRLERVGSKMGIDATKPSLSWPAERENFTKAMPYGYDSVDLDDFWG